MASQQRPPSKVSPKPRPKTSVPPSSPSASIPARPSRARPVILSIAVTAITILGAYYGAGLKESWDRRRSSNSGSNSVGGAPKERITATNEDKEKAATKGMIEALETRRARLVREADGLRRKIEDVRSRMDGEGGGLGRGKEGIWKIVEGRGEKRDGE